jgi:hypothetical protein
MQRVGLPADDRDDGAQFSIEERWNITMTFSPDDMVWMRQLENAEHE